MLLRKIAVIAAAGIDCIQIREKDLSARALSRLVHEGVCCSKLGPGGDHGVTHILVNDRLDVALSEQADGVHLGEHGLPVNAARLLVESRFQVAQALWSVHENPAPRDFQVGASCHSVRGVEAAAEAGASYVIFGPVFATPSKTHFGRPQGLGELREACQSVKIPVLAIGGITVSNAGIAAIRLFQDAPDPVATIKQLRQLFA
jgi:thiamine-phosphate pyrophosphorylase